MRTPTSFLLEHDAAQRVALITLNRPAVLNALTFDVYEELRDTFQRIDNEVDARAIVITGAGNGFCSGGDVREIIQPLLARSPAELRAFTGLTCDLIRAMRTCPRPIVGAINGIAAGAGAVIAAACDIRIAAQAARFAFLFTKIGLSGADMGAAWLLPRIVGLGHASELLMTGTTIDAMEALRIGLVNKVVANEDLISTARAMAGRLASGPRAAIADTKHALEDESTMDLLSALSAEAERQAAMMTGPDFREGFEAFRDKRAPDFS